MTGADRGRRRGRRRAARAPPCCDRRRRSPRSAGSAKCWARKRSRAAWAERKVRRWRCSDLPRSSSPSRCCAATGSICARRSSADFTAWARLREPKPRVPCALGADLAGGRFDPRRFSPAVAPADRRNGARRILSFLIFDAGADALLGGLTLGGIRRGVAQSATLGYWMGAPHAGKGRMTRAVAVAGRSASRRCGCTGSRRRVCRKTSPRMTLLERNGFQREGLARAYLRINGAWRDHLLYALVEPEATRLG